MVHFHFVAFSLLVHWSHCSDVEQVHTVNAIPIDTKVSSEFAYGVSDVFVYNLTSIGSSEIVVESQQREGSLP